MNILVDVVKQYDDKKKQFLVDMWTKTILEIARQEDPRKILSFLNKVGIVNIDESKKLVYIGVPNEFIFTQVKKFFSKSLKAAIHKVYNPQFNIKFDVYTPFSKNNDLLVNLKKLLNIKETQKKIAESNFQDHKSQLSEYFGILFDAKYTFDTFITGSSNELAFSAAKAVAENPGTAHNPLFLYGTVGLGKTHLMQAIGNKIMEISKDKVVVYLPSVKLIDQIINAIRHNKMNILNKKFEDVDVLLIDDIQFLAGKDKTQEIFHNIFNDFHLQKKQIIMSSDHPPKELLHIEPRLKSRFALGMVADIKQPDYETRIAIMQSKLEQKNEFISSDILSIIAEHIKSNVRELEGALNILITKQKLLSKDLDESDAYDCLQTLGYAQVGHKINGEVLGDISSTNRSGVKSFTTLVQMVAEYYSLSVADIKSDSRKREITQCRQILMLLAKRYFKRTLEKIGDFFGGKNHASVIYAVNNMEKKLKTDENIRHDYNVFVERVE